MTELPDHIINIHGHLHKSDDIDELVRDWDTHNVRRFCCLCIGGPFGVDRGGEYFGADELLPWLMKYPDIIVGFADVNVSKEPSPVWEIKKRKNQGFTGLKFILPAYPYNDERYFHIYEAAEQLGMPIVFHTGYVSNPPQGGRGLDIDSLRMHPGHFDRIARAFPDLTLIGAHLGLPFSDIAQTMALSHANVYFDICGGSGKLPHLSRLKRALAPFPGADWDNPGENLSLGLFEKTVFGTDNPPAAIWIESSIEILAYLHIPTCTRELFWWKNAAKILGINSL